MHAYSIGSSKQVHVEANGPSMRRVLHDESDGNRLKSSDEADECGEREMGRVFPHCDGLKDEERSPGKSSDDQENRPLQPVLVGR